MSSANYSSTVRSDAMKEWKVSDYLRREIKAAPGGEEALDRYDAVLEEQAQALADVAREASATVSDEAANLNALLRQHQAAREASAVPYPASSGRA